MFSKLDSQIDQYLIGDKFEKGEVKINVWRAKIAIKQQRRNIQKRLFGEHYNYCKVGLNKQKKYLLEEQRNTEIERSNRILLQKIQRISKRSVPIATRKRIFTQEDEKNYPTDTESNLTARQNQNVTHNIKSLGQLEKINSNDFKSIRGQPKFLFKGSKTFDGKLILIKTYISNGKFTIAADLGRVKQKIYFEMDQYRTFFKDVLGADHSKILQYFTYNGQVLQISGIRQQNVTLQQKQQVLLPSIHPKRDFSLQILTEQKKMNEKDEK